MRELAELKREKRLEMTAVKRQQKEHLAEIKLDSELKERELASIKKKTLIAELKTEQLKAEEEARRVEAEALMARREAKILLEELQAVKDSVKQEWEAVERTKRNLMKDANDAKIASMEAKIASLEAKESEKAWEVMETDDESEVSDVSDAHKRRNSRKSYREAKGRGQDWGWGGENPVESALGWVADWFVGEEGCCTTGRNHGPYDEVDSVYDEEDEY